MNYKNRILSKREIERDINTNTMKKNGLEISNSIIIDTETKVINNNNNDNSNIISNKQINFENSNNNFEKWADEAIINKSIQKSQILKKRNNSCFAYEK